MSICSMRLVYRILLLTDCNCPQIGGTLLMGAAGNGRVEALQVLLDSKASIDIENEVECALSCAFLGLIVPFC